MADEMTLEAFAQIAKQAGLTLDEAETVRMHEGYLGLQTPLARLPAAPAMADEPAVVFLGPGMRISL
ncbi:MAG: hypothetical protein ACK4QW_11795 [Alphaproteobacteria bacterium]